MFKCSDTCKKILTCVIFLGVVAFIIGIFFVDSILSYGLGILLGTTFSLVKVLMLEKTLEKAVDMDPNSAQLFTRANYTFRFFLTVGLIVVVSLLSHVNIIGVIIGLLTIQPAVYIVNFILNKKIGGE